MIEQCFNKCVQSMRSKHLSKGEIVCIQNCSEKYIDIVNRMSYRMQDIERENKNPSHDFSVCNKHLTNYTRAFLLSFCAFPF